MTHAPGIPAIPLPEFEIALLNKVIHTRTFGDYNELKNKLQDLVEQQKDELISTGEIAATDYPLHKTQVVNNMLQFLVRNEFFGTREGGVHFLTEKGKYLQAQGTIQKYLEWQLAREEQLITEMHIIEERGYLDKDQTFKKEHHPTALEPDEDTKKNFGWYVFIIIVLIVLAAIGKSNKWW